MRTAAISVLSSHGVSALSKSLACASGSVTCHSKKKARDNPRCTLPQGHLGSEYTQDVPPPRDALGRNTPKTALKTGTSWVSALGRRRLLRASRLQQADDLLQPRFHLSHG